MFLVLALLATGGAPLASAASGDVPVSVLGIEAGENTPDSVAATLTDALRQRVASSKGYRLVPGRDLVEVKLVFSCPDEAASCMSNVAKTLGANKLIFGGVKRSADGYLVTLKMLDATKQSVDAWVSEQISRAAATGPAVRGPAQRWFASLTGQASNGTIRVSADVVGASVLLDGLPVGVTTAEPLLLQGIESGRHEVTVTKPGLDPQKREVTVRANATEELAVRLSAGVPGVTAPPPVSATGEPVPGAEAQVTEAASGDDKTALKVGTWSTVGLGVAALGFGIFSGLKVLDIDSQLDPLRRFPCESDPQGPAVCTSDGERRPLNEAEVKQVKDLKSDGDSYRTMQFIAYPAAAVLLGVGGYLFYKAYLEDGDAAAPETPSSARTRRRSGGSLVVLPQVGPSIAGVGAAFRF